MQANLLLGSIPVELILIMLIIGLSCVVLGFYFYLGKNFKTIEFRVTCINLFIIGLLVALAMIIAQFEYQIFLVIILYSIGFVFLIYLTYYTSRIIRNSRINLQKIIEKSKQASTNVSNMATELATNASEVNASAEEISSTTQEVSKGAVTQLKQLKEINQTAININDLAENVKNSSDDIYKIMGLITNIAEQTNLLALNASIEAGRAGEYGRGFAVVADEVRKLAEESKSAVGNSNEKINLIITQIKKTVEFVKKIFNEIQDSLTLSEETASAMEEINSSAEEQTSSMEEINATASKLGEEAESLKAILGKKEHSGKINKYFGK